MQPQCTCTLQQIKRGLARASSPILEQKNLLQEKSAAYKKTIKSVFTLVISNRGNEIEFDHMLSHSINLRTFPSS